ncbi:DUF475 domain-containing protein, partial [Streptomyces kunmingensis]|nr:DUF475 domain-containing protein [Streptomyces kunmingensis]
IITGLIGVVLIAWSFFSSVRRNKRIAAEQPAVRGGRT